MKKQKSLLEEIIDLIIKLLPLYGGFLLLLWFANRQEFWRWVIIGIGVNLAFLFVVWLVLWFRDKHRQSLISYIVEKKELRDDFHNFINRFGREKDRSAWTYMNYGFNTERLKIFNKTLIEKNLKIKNIDDLKFILKRFIDDKEEILIKSGFESEQFKFSALSGTDFENLLARLYENMGYIVQLPGGKGDQGGDLVLNKNGQRILVQAKRYSGNIGNRAVQQAVAAKKYYDCNRVMLIGSSNFTREALDLASVNEVELIGKRELQGLLFSHLKESWD
jgi:HJR/Mrr/RecB family endonuclease